jgi:hypothetical protein
MNTDGANQRQLTHNSVIDIHPGWLKQWIQAAFLVYLLVVTLKVLEQEVISGVLPGMVKMPGCPHYIPIMR